MKFFERLVLSQLKDIIEPLLDPLQFVCWANRLAKVAVNMGLHYILHHLNQPASILFVDLSSTFSTAIPDSLHLKLTQLTVPTSNCLSITKFLMGRQQQVRLRSITSHTRSSAPVFLKGMFSPQCSSPTTLIATWENHL